MVPSAGGSLQRSFTFQSESRRPSERASREVQLSSKDTHLPLSRYSGPAVRGDSGEEEEDFVEAEDLPHLVHGELLC